MVKFGSLLEVEIVVKGVKDVVEVKVVKVDFSDI